MKQEFTDIMVIGAGPSGAVAAGYLQQTEHKVLMIEKEKFPRYAIGESLIPRCMDNFEEAGLLDVLQKQDYQKKYGARFLRNDQLVEFDFSNKFGNGWDWTWQVPRDHFDHVLAEEIQRKGTKIYFETVIKSLVRNDKNWRIVIEDKLGQMTEITAKFIIDSSGNGRVLADYLGLNKPPKFQDHSSIFTQIKESNRPEGIQGEQIVFEIIETGVWFWYIPFSNGISSLGFVGRNSWFENFNTKNSEDVFQQMLKTSKNFKGRFHDENFLFDPVMQQNFSRSVEKFYGEGFALTGNSAEFLDPVFSSGVAFATETGLLSAKLAARELSGKLINWEKEYSEYIQKGVDVFSTYVKAWYNGDLQEIFFHHNQNEQFKSQICSVLAGYVWDQKNPFVRNHEKALKGLHDLIVFDKIN
ncbi:NAD(P)/FAD-dependent oxidoreductase [Gramella sp. AN32]|uniref:NAD(P)/FAD-dependent oxidoreductase n=1 Tax=Christiangramia antarctica TaxID=2058158 RepID=A0ABW5WXY1_9FLAO|nr:NAD(P)/FAD-dependent oxidoreductase [Gramella sp. AN32]MCM4156752.1 pyridine nucleotide-disulfide oxidoreductase [Gramella sp. AN32]